MRKDLVLVLIFLGEIAIALSMGLYMEPLFPMIVLPLLITLAYAGWCEKYVLAFIGGLVFPWAFPTMLFLWHYFLQSGVILDFPPEGFVFFSGISLAYGVIGFIVVKVALKLKQSTT